MNRKQMIECSANLLASANSLYDVDTELAESLVELATGYLSAQPQKTPFTAPDIEEVQPKKSFITPDIQEVAPKTPVVEQTAPVTEPVSTVQNTIEAEPITPTTPVEPVHAEPVAKPNREIVHEIGKNMWNLDNDVISYTAKMRIERTGVAPLDIDFSISPIKPFNGVSDIVPVIVNGRIEQGGFHLSHTQAWSEGSAGNCLTYKIKDFEFYIMGSYDDNGKFNVRIVTTGRSADCGDVLTLLEPPVVTGHAPAPVITFTNGDTMTIAFSNDVYYGIRLSDGFDDEANESHDLMADIDGNYTSVDIVKQNGFWTVSC